MAKSENSSSGCTVVGAGCCVSLCVALLVFAGVGYLGYRVFKGSYSGLKELSQIALVENEIINHTAFVPPADGLMSLEQVESLVYIQTQIKESMGPEFRQIVVEQRDLIERLDRLSDFGKIRSLLGLSRKLLKPVGLAKRAQIDAINREGISMSEYRWLCAQAMQAFGLPDRTFDIRRLLKKDNGDTEGAEPSEADPAQNQLVVHPQNRRFLEAHVDVLSQTLMLSAVGL